MDVPRSPCDYSDDEDAPQLTTAKRPRSPCAPEVSEMREVGEQILNAFKMLRKNGVTETQTFDSPKGLWYVRCQTRKTYNNRSHDVVVTRPRGVGGTES